MAGEGAKSHHALNETELDLLAEKRLRAVRLLLGHRKLDSTARYLGVEVGDAPKLAKKKQNLRFSTGSYYRGDLQS